MYNPYYYSMNRNLYRKSNNNYVSGVPKKGINHKPTKDINCDKGFSLEEPAPEFTLQGIVDGVPKDVSLSDYKGKWVVVFFYGSDFTFV